MSESGSSKFILQVENLDAPISVSCPICQHKGIHTAKAILRGLHENCQECGALIKTNPGRANPHVGKIKISSYRESIEHDLVIRSDGIWLFLDEAERSILDTLDYDSDRAVALVVGSMIENRLKRTVLARFQRESKIEDRLFHTSGPLGGFSAKIDLACLLGLISPLAHADLVLLKDIRNLFAHNLDIKDFCSQKIKDKAKNFKLIESYVGETEPGARESLHIDPNAKPALFVTHANRRKKQAKDRYLMTAQFLTIRFAPAELLSHPLPLI